jgi:hypothetical protein
MNKQPRTNDKGRSSSLGVGRGANKPFTVENKFVTKIIKEPWTWTDPLEKQPKRDGIWMSFGLWLENFFFLLLTNKVKSLQ